MVNIVDYSRRNVNTRRSIVFSLIIPCLMGLAVLLVLDATMTTPALRATAAIGRHGEPAHCVDGCCIHSLALFYPHKCIKEQFKHLPGWTMFHLSHAPDTICIARSETGCLDSAPNPLSHWDESTGEGNAGLRGHPYRGAIQDAYCPCPVDTFSQHEATRQGKLVTATSAAAVYANHLVPDANHFPVQTSGTPYYTYQHQHN